MQRSGYQENHDSDTEDDEDDDGVPWEEEAFYDGADQYLHQHAQDYFSNAEGDDSTAVAYAMNGLPPLNNAAYCTKPHSAKVCTLDIPQFNCCPHNCSRASITLPPLPSGRPYFDI